MALGRALGLCAVAAAVLAPAAQVYARAVTTAPGPAVVDALDRSILEPLGPSAGAVDWTLRTLRSRGQSAGPIGAYLPPDVAPYAQRRAESLAQEGLIRLLRATPLSKNCTVGEAVAQDPALGALIYTAVQNMQVIRATYDAQGGVALDVALSLDTEQGGLGALWVALRARTGAPCAAAATAAPAAPADLSFMPPRPSTVDALCSGIVINARGLGFVPSVWPRIVDLKGRLLYGPAQVPADVLVLRGLMGATRSLEVAMADARVAPLPQVIGARSVLEGDPYTLVLGDDEAQSFAALGALVGDARIVAIVD